MIDHEIQHPVEHNVSGEESSETENMCKECTDHP